MRWRTCLSPDNLTHQQQIECVWHLNLKKYLEWWVWHEQFFFVRIFSYKHPWNWFLCNFDEYNLKEKKKKWELTKKSLTIESWDCCCCRAFWQCFIRHGDSVFYWIPLKLYADHTFKSLPLSLSRHLKSILQKSSAEELLANFSAWSFNANAIISMMLYLNYFFWRHFCTRELPYFLTC